MPPYHTTKAKVNDEKISATGKKIELYQTVFNQAFLCLSFIFLKLSNSSFSLANCFTIFIPEILSCTNEFKLATSLRTSSKALFIYFWKIFVASKIKGKEIKTMRLNSKFIDIITNDTNNIFIKSEMIINRP